MNRRALFLVPIVCALALACGAPAPTATAATAFPDFSLAALDGGTRDRASFAGHVVVYDFWATWCGPCHLQADILRQSREALAAKGAEIVGIATGEDPQVVRDFAAKNGFPWKVLVDPEEKLSGALDVAGLPTLVITDARGAIVFRSTGVVDPGRLEREVAKAAGG